MTTTPTIPPNIVSNHILAFCLCRKIPDIEEGTRWTARKGIYRSIKITIPQSEPEAIYLVMNALTVEVPAPLRAKIFSNNKDSVIVGGIPCYYEVLD